MIKLDLNLPIISPIMSDTQLNNDRLFFNSIFSPILATLDNPLIIKKVYQIYKNATFRRLTLFSTLEKDCAKFRLSLFLIVSC